MSFCRKKLGEFFQIPAIDPCREAIESALAQTSCKMVKLMCRFIICFLLFFLVNLVLWKNRYPAHLRHYYFELYLGLLPLTLAAMFTASAALRKEFIPPGRYFFFETLYALVLCLWGSCVSLVDQYNGSDLNVFSYVTLCVAAFTVLNPRQSLLVFGGNLLFFNILLPFVPGKVFLPAGLFNTLFLSLLAFLISTVLYRSKVMALRDKIIIQEQYDVIKCQNAKLQEIALTDGLTGLYNRRFLERTLSEKRFSDKTNFAGLMVDVDYFKRYNDTYGHVQGDLGLQSLAHTVRDFY